MKPCSFPQFSLLILLLIALQTGCASRVPLSVPLPEDEKPFVFEQLQAFQGRECDHSLDGDVILEWQFAGKAEKFPGLLQLQDPAFLRFSVVDPLGRQLVILASDGSGFTLVNNRKAKALAGPLDSTFWRKYIPGFILPQEYMEWLTGRLPADSLTVEEVRRDKTAAEAVWLITPWQDGVRHHVLFDPAASRVGRHIVENEDREILLDIAYSDHRSDNRKCPEPHLLQVRGKDLTGTVQVRFAEIYPAKQIPESYFSLSIPDHYTLETVQ